MSKFHSPVIRAVSLFTLAGTLAGCPAVEVSPPDEEVVSIVPESGVWGIHIENVSSDGYCGGLAAGAVGRVFRMDVDADEGGELAISILGAELFGGHSDGTVWADAEYSGYQGWGEPVPMDEIGVVEVQDGGEDGDEHDSEDIAVEGHSGSSGGDGSAPPEDDRETEHDEEWDEDWDCDPPEHEQEAGVYISMDADLRDAESMDGFIVITVSNGWDACTFDADIRAAWLGDETEPEVVEVMEGEAEVAPAPVESKESAPAE